MIPTTALFNAARDLAEAARRTTTYHEFVDVGDYRVTLTQMDGVFRVILGHRRVAPDGPAADAVRAGAGMYYAAQEYRTYTVITDGGRPRYIPAWLFVWREGH